MLLHVQGRLFCNIYGDEIKLIWFRPSQCPEIFQFLKKVSVNVAETSSQLIWLCWLPSKNNVFIIQTNIKLFLGK